MPSSGGSNGVVTSRQMMPAWNFGGTILTLFKVWPTATCSIFRQVCFTADSREFIVLPREAASRRRVGVKNAFARTSTGRVSRKAARHTGVNGLVSRSVLNWRWVKGA